MDLPAKRVFETIANKGVDNLYHANSVITACQFIRSGALLSRGSVARRGLFQTPQKSDEADQFFGLWFDVLTDSVDIHARASRANAYGPVLFVLDVEKLRASYTGRIWVTKFNPTKWADKSSGQRWFQSISDLDKNFTYGAFNQMIVFRHCGGELPINEALKEIVLDDPHLEESKRNIDYFSMAYGAIRLALTEGGLKVPIRKRGCNRGCRCTQDYENNPSLARQMFVPRVAGR